MNRLSRYCDGFLEAAWLLAIITVPLYFNFDSNRIFDADKVALFRSVVWVAVAVWIVKLLSERGLRFEHIQRPASIKDFLHLPLVASVGALLVVYFLSTVFSIAPRESIFGSYERFQGILSQCSYILLFIVITANLRRREQVERIITTLALVSFPISVYSILQHYGLDPYNWGNDVALRSIGTMGHPIFAAAFLNMTFIITLSRIIGVLSTFAEKSSARMGDLVRAGLYIIIAMLNLIAIWFAVARGPLVGLFVGLAFFGLALVAYWRLKKIFYVLLAIAACALGFLITLNIPNGLFASLRDAPALGPLGHIFDPQVGTGRMRVMMWQGVSKLVSPHTPLLFPDHAPDSVNLIRPLIGYGFDTLRLTYEGYYNPEMFALEARDIVFDRSHNEFWDTLAFTGILGLIAKYGFFLAIIYYALKWIGFIKSVRERKLYWGLTLIGGALGALGLTLSMGMAFLGIGLPAGLLAGSVGILIYRIFRPLSNSEMPLKPWQAITVVSIFSAIISHYVETLFSFSVVSTLTLLWILPALLVVTGWIVPMAHEQVDAGEATEILGRRTELQHVGINAGLVISIMLVLAMDFISNYQTNVDASTILETSLTVISRPAPHTSYGIFWLLMGTLFVSSIILQLEEASLHTQRFNGPSLLFTLGIALFISALAWMLRANQLAALKEISPLYLETYAANLFWRTKAFYIGLLLTAFTWGVAFKPNGVSRRAPQKLINILGYIAFPIGAIVLSAILNLRPIQADVIYINAKGQLNTGQHKIALALFDKALELSPYEGIYLTDAASAYIAYSDLMPDPMQKQALLQRALSYAQKAYNLSPLFVERTINLARINKMMGAMMQDDGQRSARYYLANSFYASALSIKPTRPDYWMEWANLLIQIGDTKGAREKIDKAIAVDNTYEPPYEVSAQLYMTEANDQASSVLRVKLFEKAIQAYQDEAELLVRRGENPAFVLVEIGKIQENLQRYEEARTTVSQIAELGIGEYQWEIYKKLAELSDMLNDVAAQREYLKQAIAIAPAQEVQSLQAELDLLKP